MNMPQSLEGFKVSKRQSLNDIYKYSQKFTLYLIEVYNEHVRIEKVEVLDTHVWKFHGTRSGMSFHLNHLAMLRLQW